MIAIIDYRAGNLTSVRLAFESLNVEARITDKPDEILEAERVVFPGVGAAGSAMQSLQELGLVAVIEEVVGRGTPFLGICLGTQILLDFSEEDDGVDCLGLIPGRVRLFTPEDPFEKVPQMGWNSVAVVQSHPVMQGIGDAYEFYFVHSYYPAPASRDAIIGETQYGGVGFASIVGRDNLIATQFHPEKSGKIGLRLLQNFVNWKVEA